MPYFSFTFLSQYNILCDFCPSFSKVRLYFLSATRSGLILNTIKDNLYINMKKEELVHLHMLLAQFKKYCEVNGVNADFSKYNELGISPFQVHRSKEEHKQGIFVLVTELASMAVRDTLTETKRLQKERRQE